MPVRSIVLLLLTAPLALVPAACSDEGSAPKPSEHAVPFGTARRVADEFAEDFPSLTTVSNADVWVAYLSWRAARGDEIALRRLPPVGASRNRATPGGTDEPADGPAWDEPATIVYRSPSQVLFTALAPDAEDVLHVVWSEQVVDGWALRTSSVSAAGAPGTLGSPGEPRTLAGGPGRRCLEPALVADERGGLLLVWSDLDQEAKTIRARARTPAGSWGPELVLSDPAQGAWEPDAVATGPGAFAVVWDAAVGGDYDVQLARLSVDGDGQLSVDDRRSVASTPAFEAHASIASHGERLYVAWEVGPENWGREGSTNRLEISLHFQRSVEVVAIEGDRVAPLAEPFMAGVSVALEDSCEKPVVRIDGSGNLLLFFRGLPLPPEVKDPTEQQFIDRVDDMGGRGAGWRTSIWFTFLSRWDGHVWADVAGAGRHHAALNGSEGRSDSPIAVTHLLKGGLAYAVVGDARSRDVTAQASGGAPIATDLLNWWRPISDEPTHITVDRVSKGAAVAALPTGSWTTLPPPRSTGTPWTTVRTRTLFDGTPVQLALGDLHRHTDLSRCSSNWDGPFTDALRYAFDVGALQYMAVTDHFEHMSRYDWWRSLAYADAYHAPGRMVNLRGYERADAKTGHRNMVSGESTPPLVAYRNTFEIGRDEAWANAPIDLWAHLRGRDVITIPHTPAGMYEDSSVFDWLTFNPRYDRVVEIWQGYRGSSEAIDAPRAIQTRMPQRYVRPALDGGLHFGVIGSSDHQSSDGAFAGAWVTDLTRNGVFEALHSRRTFASTVRMALWAEWAGIPMGVSAVADAGPTPGLTVEVDVFGGSLERIDLIVDGMVVETRPVAGAVAELTFTGEHLDVPAEGSRYAYVRVHTTDGEMGWTSPVRLSTESSPGPNGWSGAEGYDEATGRALELSWPFSEKWRGRPDDGDG